MHLKHLTSGRRHPSPFPIACKEPRPRASGWSELRSPHNQERAPTSNSQTTHKIWNWKVKHRSACNTKTKQTGLQEKDWTNMTTAAAEPTRRKGRGREESSQTRPGNKRFRYESVTNTNKDTAELGQSTNEKRLKPLLLRRTSPPADGTQCPAKKRAARSCPAGYVPHLNVSFLQKITDPAQQGAAQSRQGRGHCSPTAALGPTLPTSVTICETFDDALLPLHDTVLTMGHT